MDSILTHRAACRPPHRRALHDKAPTSSRTDVCVELRPRLDAGEVLRRRLELPEVVSEKTPQEDFVDGAGGELLTLRHTRCMRAAGVPRKLPFLFSDR